MVEEEPIRVRLPEGRQVLGVIEEMLGSRFKVACTDGYKRICRIPGKFRKKANINIGDVVLIEPWEVESTEKGDILWIYTKTHATWLRNKGYIK
ncbi:MAG: translation initiation factor eIF-1A [Candidatus Aenigmatarchaeota archaeon]